MQQQTGREPKKKEEQKNSFSWSSWTWKARKFTSNFCFVFSPKNFFLFALSKRKQQNEKVKKKLEKKVFPPFALACNKSLKSFSCTDFGFESEENKKIYCNSPFRASVCSQTMRSPYRPNDPNLIPFSVTAGKEKEARNMKTFRGAELESCLGSPMARVEPVRCPMGRACPTRADCDASHSTHCPGDWRGSEMIVCLIMMSLSSPMLTSCWMMISSFAVESSWESYWGLHGREKTRALGAEQLHPTAICSTHRLRSSSERSRRHRRRRLPWTRFSGGACDDRYTSAPLWWSSLCGASRCRSWRSSLPTPIHSSPASSGSARSRAMWRCAREAKGWSRCRVAAACWTARESHSSPTTRAPRRMAWLACAGGRDRNRAPAPSAPSSDWSSLRVLSPGDREERDKRSVRAQRWCDRRSSLTFNDSAVFRSADNWQYSTFTSPLYMNSINVRNSLNRTSLSITMGCLAGWSRKRLWKYDEQAERTTCNWEERRRNLLIMRKCN